MKKKKKLKKGIKLLFSLALVIIISYISITIFKHFTNQEMLIPLPKDYRQNEQNEQTKKLKTLKYSEETIKDIEDYVSSQNIDYIIDNKINHEIIENLINETYYIDDYLQKYIEYYNKNQSLSYSKIITTVNTHTDNEFYTNTEKTDTTLGKYVILNKYYYADASYHIQAKILLRYQANTMSTEQASN